VRQPTASARGLGQDRAA